MDLQWQRLEITYLHQIPSLQGLCDDGGHGGADATKDHQVFGTIAYGIKKGPQPLGVVTLQTQREEDERKGEKNETFWLVFVIKT